MSTLYRDYRPQDFQQVFGQNHIKITIKNELIANRVGGAYLFCGPRAVGKTTLARIFAKAVNCEERKDGEADPCNHCPSCVSSSQGKNLDVIEIDAASNTGVDHVRENIIASARLAPNGHKYKVFIIDEVHMLSTAAWNALLKIMEEPPAHILFILCTTEIHKVPLTIISRCERFDFKRISLADTVEKLRIIVAKEGIEAEADVLAAIAQYSGGHLRDAESILGQIIAISGKKIDQEKAALVLPKNNNREILELLEYLARKDTTKALRLVNGLLDSGVNIKNFISETVELIRKLLLNKVSPGLAENVGLDFGESLELKINELQEKLSLENIIHFAKRFNSLAGEQKNSLIIQLPLELAIVEMCLSQETALPAKNTITPTRVAPVSIKNEEVSPETPTTPTPETQNIKLKDAATIDADELDKKWVEFLIKIKHLNHSLSFVMQNSKPEGISDGILTLGFKYKLHSDRVGQVEIRDLIEKTLQEVYAAKIKIKVRLDDSIVITPRDTSEIISNDEKKIETKIPEGNSFINSFLQNFGGEIIS
ncbi:MAG: DNA polymerase III subunit gamma/tau [Patescibacteria group bacterium]